MSILRPRWAGFLGIVMLILAPSPVRGDGPGLADVPSLFDECGGPPPPRVRPGGKPWPDRTRGQRLTAPGIAVLEKLAANPALTAKLRVPGGRKGGLIVEMRSTLADPKSGAYTWVGHLPAGDGGELVLSSVPGGAGAPMPLGSPGRVWRGSLRSDKHGSFQILGGKGSDCLVFRRSTDEPPRCGNEPKLRGKDRPRIWEPPGPLRPPVEVAADEPVDLLVIPTPGAIEYERSLATSDVDPLVCLKADMLVAVGQLNEAFVNSRVRGSVRLVGCEQLTNPPPDPIGTSSSHNANDDAMDILDMLTEGTAPWAVEARALRETRGADVVCLLFQGPEGADGFANLLNQDPHPSERAFCVVPLEHALSVYMLAHEVGHCLGCCHEPPDDYCDHPLYDYGHGHRFEDPQALDDAGAPSRFATLMARPYDAVACKWYTPVLYFSSPTVPYAGTGPFTGTADANNASAVQATLPKVAAYRPHVPTVP